MEILREGEGEHNIYMKLGKGRCPKAGQGRVEQIISRQGGRKGAIMHGKEKQGRGSRGG